MEEETKTLTEKERISLAESYKIKADFFKKNKMTIFIKTINGRFYQGSILKIYDEYLVIVDNRYGENIITYKEMDIFDKYASKKEGDDGRN